MKLWNRLSKAVSCNFTGLAGNTEPIFTGHGHGLVINIGDVTWMKCIGMLLVCDIDTTSINSEHVKHQSSADIRTRFTTNNMMAMAVMILYLLHKYTHVLLCSVLCDLLTVFSLWFFHWHWDHHTIVLGHVKLPNTKLQQNKTKSKSCAWGWTVNIERRGIDIAPLHYSMFTIPPMIYFRDICKSCFPWSVKTHF